jgi:hypothetical protein
VDEQGRKALPFIDEGDLHTVGIEFLQAARP